MRDTVTGKLVDTIRHTNWRSIIRPRTIAYFLVWAVIGLAMLTVLSLRSPLALNVLHDRNPLYVELRDGSVRNGYDVKILNMTPAPRTVRLSIDGLPGAELSLADGGETVAETLDFELDPDKVMPVRLYVKTSPEARPEQKTRFTITITTPDGTASSTAETTFEVPETDK